MGRLSANPPAPMIVTVTATRQRFLESVNVVSGLFAHEGAHIPAIPAPVLVAGIGSCIRRDLVLGNVSHG
jgi:hypothetical protein